MKTLMMMTVAALALGAAARPVFYVYGGWNLPERASWDIKCRTDEELADCAKTYVNYTDEAVTVDGVTVGPLASEVKFTEGIGTGR